jgi:hypothetical protein
MDAFHIYGIYSLFFSSGVGEMEGLYKEKACFKLLGLAFGAGEFRQNQKHWVGIGFGFCKVIKGTALGGDGTAARKQALDI